MSLTATHLRAAASANRPAYNPATQWANSELGYLLHPTDWRTLFQTIDGQTPVTAAGQPVALALDCKYGVPLRRNLFNLSKTVTPTATTTADYNVLTVQYGSGTMSLDYNKDTTANTEHYAEKQYAVLDKTTYTYSFFVKGDGSSKYAYIRTAIRGAAGIRIDLSGTAAEGNVVTISGTGPSGAVNYGGGLWRVWLTYETTSAGVAVFRSQILSAAGLSVYVGNGTGYYVGGHQLELGGLTDYQEILANWAATVPGSHASQPTATSRPVSAIDANGTPCVVFDGTDDFWQVSGINLAGFNKLTMYAAIRKTSNTAGSIMGQSNSLSFAGFWELAARVYAANDLALTVAGSASNTVQNYLSYPANTSNVIAAQIDGSGATMAEYFNMRVNGQPASLGASTAGPFSVGGFKNEAITIGSRGSGASRFAGNMYTLGLRSGLTTDADSAKMQAWINKQTRIY